MPPKTVDAFLDHGKVELAIEKNFDEEKAYLAKLKTLDIDIDKILQEIQDAGVEAFQNSFTKLIQSISQKK